MSKSFLVILLFVLVIFAGGYYVMSKQRFTTTPAPVAKAMTPTPIYTQTTVSPEVTTAASSPAATIPSSWKTYTSGAFGFSIKYPPDMQHDTQAGQEERFYKHGASQSQGTEMYDGILVLIKSGSLSGKSFDAWVNQKYEDTKNDPVQPRVGPKIPVTIAGKQGMSFRVSSLGDRNAIYLPKGTDQYLEILDVTVEPQGSTQGFQKIVDQMLSSITYTQ